MLLTGSLPTLPRLMGGMGEEIEKDIPLVSDPPPPEKPEGPPKLVGPLDIG